MLSTDQPLTFDLQLAREASNDNPVFYVQYGHARIVSLIRRAGERDPALVDAARERANLGRLTGEAELTLMRRLSEFGAIVDGVARTRAPHRLPKYARDIAAGFHAFYDQSPVLPVLDDDRELALARLALALATQTILAHALALCGVSAPDRMQRA
jgi:arginyl-tRNA synthetase